MTPQPYCYVCDGKRTDWYAIKLHNERCSLYGERAYPQRPK